RLTLLVIPSIDVRLMDRTGVGAMKLGLSELYASFRDRALAAVDARDPSTARLYYFTTSSDTGRVRISDDITLNGFRDLGVPFPPLWIKEGDSSPVAAPSAHLDNAGAARLAGSTGGGSDRN